MRRPHKIHIKIQRPQRVEQEIPFGYKILSSFVTGLTSSVIIFFTYTGLFPIEEFQRYHFFPFFFSLRGSFFMLQITNKIQFLEGKTSKMDYKRERADQWTLYIFFLFFYYFIEGRNTGGIITTTYFFWDFYLSLWSIEAINNKIQNSFGNIGKYLFICWIPGMMDSFSITGMYLIQYIPIPITIISLILTLPLFYYYKFFRPFALIKHYSILAQKKNKFMLLPRVLTKLILYFAFQSCELLLGLESNPSPELFPIMNLGNVFLLTQLQYHHPKNKNTSGWAGYTAYMSGIEFLFLLIISLFFKERLVIYFLLYLLIFIGLTIYGYVFHKLGKKVRQIFETREEEPFIILVPVLSDNLIIVLKNLFSLSFGVLT